MALHLASFIGGTPFLSGLGVSRAGQARCIRGAQTHTLLHSTMAICRRPCAEEKRSSWTLPGHALDSSQRSQDTTVIVRVNPDRGLHLSRWRLV